MLDSYLGSNSFNFLREIKMKHTTKSKKLEIQILVSNIKGYKFPRGFKVVSEGEYIEIDNEIEHNKYVGKIITVQVTLNTFLKYVNLVKEVWVMIRNNWTLYATPKHYEVKYATLLNAA